MGEDYEKLKNWQRDSYHKQMIGGFKETKEAEDGFRKAQKPWAKKLKEVRNWDFSGTCGILKQYNEYIEQEDEHEILHFRDWVAKGSISSTFNVISINHVSDHKLQKNHCWQVIFSSQWLQPLISIPPFSSLDYLLLTHHCFHSLPAYQTTGQEHYCNMCVATKQRLVAKYHPVF